LRNNVSAIFVADEEVLAVLGLVDQRLIQAQGILHDLGVVRSVRNRRGRRA